MAPALDSALAFTDDPLLLDAFRLAQHYHPSWYAEVGSRFAAARGRVVWSSAPAGPGEAAEAAEAAAGDAAYRSADRAVVVNPALRDESAAYLAATLVHEITHAVRTPQGVPRSAAGHAAAACLEEEAVAYTYEAEVYARIPARYKTDTARAARQERLLQFWRAGAVRSWLERHPLYMRLCGLAR